ncbi:unnamed protein product [Agarophyton chilense]
MPSAFITSFLPLKATPFASRSTQPVLRSVPAATARHTSHGSNGVANGSNSNWYHAPDHIRPPNTPPSTSSFQPSPSTFLDLSSTPAITHIETNPVNDVKRCVAEHSSNRAPPTSPHISAVHTSQQIGRVLDSSQVLPGASPHHFSQNIPLVEGLSNADTPLKEMVTITSYASPPLPRVLIIHCGGTFGMQQSTTQRSTTLKPSSFLADLQEAFPELNEIASLNVSTPMNLDSTRMGPDHWIKIAKLLDKHRDNYDGFVIIHGTDTMSYTGAALSLMLAGFRKPVVLTGSQRPMLMPRSDARQNLIDAVTVACRPKLQEFAVCFGGLLLRANRTMKYSSSAYRAFTSPTHPPLAVLGVDIEWNQFALWKDPGVYRPRIKLDPNVIRIPVVPGANPKVSYGDLYSRGVRGAVIESFGVGNVPDHRGAGWMGWLRSQQKLGLKIYLSTQCATGPLNPNLYNSSAAGALGATSTKRMTTEAAVVKMMLCLAHPDLHLSYPLAGEL